MNFEIDWNKNSLIPAIVQDEKNGEVLMLAYMNKEAFEKTLSSGFAHYYSRSRQRLWKKGESSGNVQIVKKIFLDCDSDSLLLLVEQKGVACHTGRKSCFYKDLKAEKIALKKTSEPLEMYNIIDALYHKIMERKESDPSVSWTAKLFQKGENTILKKVIEEAGEFCFAIKDDDKKEIIYEAADLAFHTLIALALKNIHPEAILQELKRREGVSGIEEKRNRKK